MAEDAFPEDVDSKGELFIQKFITAERNLPTAVRLLLILVCKHNEVV